MKHKLLFLLTALICFSFYGSYQTNNFKDGEVLKYRLHYGVLNAGYATLSINEENYDGIPHFHVTGKGSSTGAVRAFFKVDDTYETYFDKTSGKPAKFIRKVSEGGYTRDQVFTFDYSKKQVKIHDKKHKSVKYESFTSNTIQDILSSFYYLRNYNTDDLKTGDYINIKIFLSDGEYLFKLKILGRETMKTKFGSIKCLKIRPYVQSGRIFKEEESVTIWVTDDDNHVPVQLKASLMVGSLKADLESYSNLKNKISFTK